MSNANQTKRREETSVIQKINSALIAHIYQLHRLGQLSSLFCATVILIGLYYNSYQNMALLFSWYIFYCFVFFFRLMLFKLYSKQTNPSEVQWRNLFIVGALLGGLSWGFAGSILFYQADSTQQTLIILVLAGITSGAVPLLSADKLAAIAFITASLAPTIALLFLSDMNAAYPIFGFAAIGYYLYLIILCIKLHAIIKNSIGLKFENDILLYNISKTKNQLEVINKKLAHAATHDPLTNLANRSLFELSLKKAIEQAKRNNSILALFYIDLDNFKEINDAYGHHIGDQLLLSLIERISKNTRKSDVVARLGGDELTIILEDAGSIEIIHLTAQRLCGVLAAPVIIHNHTISVTASIGISMYPKDGQDAETLLKNADKAMYYVKEHGRNNFSFSSYDNSADISSS